MIKIASPFSSASHIFEQGYSIIPIMPKNQIPAEFIYNQWRPMGDWSKYCRQRATDQDIDKWNEWPDANIGIACGPAGGVIGLDFDDDTEDLHARIQAMLPPTDVKKVGSRGHTAFYQYNGESNKDWKKNGLTVLQLLSEGRQTVLPPSIHPKTGKAYYYSTVDTFEWIKPSELPYLPPNFCEMMDEVFGQEKIRIRNVTSEEYGQYYGPTSREDIERALAYIPADSYGDWVNVGMALQHQMGDAGYPLWADWSQRSPKFNPKEDLERKWESFKNEGITISTVFYYAMDNGFIPRTSTFSSAPQPVMVTDDKSALAYAYGIHNDESVLKKTEKNVGIQSNDNLAEPQKITAKPEVKNNTFPKHLYDMPGLSGRIATWINMSAIRPQPILAMGAALTFVGAVKAHRVRSETNLRTNIYIISLAETASGKDHPSKCLEILAQQTGLERIMMGEIPSGPGLVKALTVAEGRSLLQIDEIGHYLAALVSKNAAGHKKEIISNIMKLFSKAGSPWRGPEYAGFEKARRDVQDPCLCLHGMSVPSRFYETLTSGEVIDGFLNRICLIASEEFLPKKNPNSIDIYDVPDHLLRDIKMIDAMKTNSTGSPLGEILTIKPAKIPYDDEARAIIDAYEAVVENRRRSLEKSANRMHAMWGRTIEIAVKIALILQEGPCITGKDMKWACEWVEHWTNYAIEQIQNNVSDNEHEKQINKLIHIIRSWCEKNGLEWMPHKELSQRTTKWLKHKERNDIIRQLIDSEMISVQEVIHNGQKGTRYKIP